MGSEGEGVYTSGVDNDGLFFAIVNNDPARGDSGGDSAHQRWLALVSAGPSKTRINWRSLALAGASLCPFNPQVVGSLELFW